MNPHTTFDTAAALETLRRIRESHAELRELAPTSARNVENERRTDAAFELALRAPLMPHDELMELFDMESFADALGELAAEIEAARQQAETKLLHDALEVYYATEILAFDPEHADLVPRLEAMRQAYEHDFGVPIPERTM